MELIKGIKTEGFAVAINKTLVISDVHIGYEESLRSRGVLIPKRNIKKITKKILETVKDNDLKCVVINGDLKHDFKVSKIEEKDVKEFISRISKKVKVVIVKGNHDTSIEHILKEVNNIEIVESLRIKDIFIVHGHKKEKIPGGVKTIMIGHQHPAIKITDKVRSERYKCFLKGKYKRMNLIVMPQFSTMSEGTDIISGSSISPFIDPENKSSFEVFIPSGKEVLYFGKVDDIKNL